VVETPDATAADDTPEAGAAAPPAGARASRAVPRAAPGEASGEAPGAASASGEDASDRPVAGVPAGKTRPGKGRARSRSGSPAVTLSDVARVAGVSDITVSRVMRDAGPIAPETRERVLEAARVTGYVHNRLAGALASARSNLVGVVLPSLSNSVFPEVMAGINAALARSGLQPIVGVTDYDMATEEALVRSMLAWKPVGLILTGLDHTRTTRRLLDAATIRVVEIMDAGGRAIDVAIGLSHRDAGAATARHLIGRGYRRFGYVGHDLGRDLRADERHTGLVQTLQRNGYDAPIEQRIDGPSSVAGGRQGLARLLAADRKVDVVVFSNDDMAVGGVFHCLAAGIRPREDLGVFGFNGLDLGQALPLPLSTIRSNRHQMGQIAVETCLREPVRPAASRIIDTGFTIIEGATA
jgi:LacI family gluconate utilization system Gnt-I transcriptional repressor